jgi:hypothetical protein
MAKKQDKKSSAGVKMFSKKPKVKRPGRVSKKRSSKNKQSKHYKKAYRGQGK